MAEAIVMVHGVNCGGWCFETFKPVFEARGFEYFAPDLVGHGADKANGIEKLTGVGIADYLEPRCAILLHSFQGNRSYSGIPWARLLPSS